MLLPIKGDTPRNFCFVFFQNDNSSNYFIFFSVVIEDTEAEVFDDKCSAQLKVSDTEL